MTERPQRPRGRRRLIVWAIVTGALVALHAALASHLAAIDPIGAVLLHREGPLVFAGVVVVVRVFLIGVAPAWGAVALAAFAIETLQRRSGPRQ